MENITDATISVEVTQRSRIVLLERLTSYLEHAVACQNFFCFRMSCLKMKWLMSHTTKCNGRKNLTCRRCKIFAALCCYHSGKCSLEECKIPYCNGKQKSVEKEPSDRIGDVVIRQEDYEPIDEHK